VIELWAGVECTVARIGDAVRDQIELTGHATRIEDLDRIAQLGARAIRYPVLWERVEEGGWSWTDERLERIRALGMRPIAGLVHHGSGPRWTSLASPGFADGLAAFARAVAERYPWVRDFTPVNEPLTTARFSGLYGHWYPHGKDDATFARALVNQCVGVSRAMAAIREIIPDARLVQTEDAGRVFSTPELAPQAEFENHRRWGSFDLLFGRVVPGHPLHDFLLGAGADPALLAELAARPCPPDVVGLNHYVTSDRWLDHRLDHWPPSTHGGNGRERYADVEAVRAREEGIVGHREVLLEAWERYGVPVAITEAHLGCTREEQARWLLEAWRGAEEAARDGADVRAVTLWAAFGSVDWSSLLTEVRGHYEAGAFDVRFVRPRTTIVASVARDLANGHAPEHPALAAPGWWRRRSAPCGAPVLVTGASGALGRNLVAALGQRGLAHVAFDRNALDIADPDAVGRVIEREAPWAVINAAGFSRVRAAELEPDRCRRENALGAGVLARACAERCARFVTFSSHFVFDGSARSPYVESAAPQPLGVYGRSKADAERWVSVVAPDALVIRSSTFFDDSDGFLARALRALACGDEVALREDRVLSATYLPDLVHAVLDLLVDGARGTFHLANAGAISPLDLVKRAAAAHGVSDRTLRAGGPGDERIVPAYSVLGSERAALLPEIDDAIARRGRLARRLAA